MDLTYTLTPKHIKELHELYQGEWWTKGRTLQEATDVVEGSQINIGILNAQGSLVAYARVLTDFTFKALIFDVIVAEDHRGEGLGEKLMQAIKSHEKLARVKSFELYCLPEMFAFYERHGFSSDVADIKLMRCLNA